ncbi:MULTISPECIES: tyrosine-type recombinase/integrase [unclassified Sphingomonas]|uniref:tyrosine-type recombinase/integrase n=1 Tax=unclassified Sphingomonas TaxID=196159 RepID=UPI0006F984B6|nr:MULTISPECIES: integrase family protein [unclassified Sphingomonas]KQM27330.1 integrase [Sphingomonas sp. Leaf9]KQM43667.1 integrase [Sphingomonas sp. Leaf11]
MPQLKLTKTNIDGKAVADARERPNDILYWDTEVKGFGVRVTPTGKKVFIAQARASADTAPVRLTIGLYGVFTVDQARDVAREHLRSLRMGNDPRDMKKQSDAMQVSLQAVCDAYVARPGKLKETSKAAITRHVATTFAAWKDKPVVSITEDMCRTRYREMLTKGLRGNREGGSPGQANQAFSVLGALLNYAGRQHKRADGSPLIAHNPVGILRDDKVRLKPRTARILDNKVGAAWHALTEWRATAHNRDTMSSIDLVRFLMLTGLRISEASSLKWSQVHLDDGYFHLPNPKNSNPVSMPLSTQAVELLKARPKVEDNPFVFPSWGKLGHIKDPRDLMKKLSVVAGMPITPHALRRTYTNVALRQCRIEKFRTDLLTNHITRDVSAEHYFDTTNLQWLQPEAQKIGDHLDLEAKKAAGANVVVLAQRA